MHPHLKDRGVWRSLDGKTYSQPEGIRELLCAVGLRDQSGLVVNIDGSSMRFLNLICDL